GLLAAGLGDRDDRARLHLRPERQRRLRRLQERLRQGRAGEVLLRRGAELRARGHGRRHAEVRVPARAMNTTAPRKPDGGRAPGRQRREHGGAHRASAAPYLFLAPAVVLFTLFTAVPIGYTVYLSLRKIKVSGLGLGKGARQEVFAGLENY